MGGWGEGRGATQHFKPGQVRGHSQTLLLYQPLCPSLWALPSSDAKKHARAPVNRQLVQGQPPTFPHPTPDLLLLLHVGLSHLSAEQPSARSDSHQFLRVREGLLPSGPTLLRTL